MVHQRSRRNMLCSSSVNKQTTKKERHQRWSEALGFCVPKIREDLCINPSFLREAPPGLPGRVTLGLHKEGVLGAKMIASNVFVEDHNKLNLNLEVAFNLLSLQMYILNNKNTTLWSSNSSRWWELSRSFHRCGSSKKTSICSQRRDLDNLKARKQCNWEIKILLKNLVHMGIFIVSTGACLFLLNLNLMIFFPWVGLKLLQDGPTGKVAWTGNPNKVASQRHEHEHDVQNSQQNARTKPRDQKDSWLLAKYKRIATWFWPFPHLHSFFPIHPPPVSVSRGS